MKKTITLVALLVSTLINAQNLHMVNGNASDYGFDFNANTGAISNLFFTFGEDDGYNISSSFVVSWGVQSDANDFGTYIEMDRVYFTQGINAYSSFVINSWQTVNLNDNISVADGDYLLVGIVDTDDDISEFNESQANNGMFLAASASETITYVSGGATGIEDQSISKSEVYPNPLLDIAQVSFNLSNSSDVSIDVYDFTGKLVLTNTFNSLHAGKNIVQFNTSELKSGVYFTKIKSGDKVVTKRIVKA